MERLFNNVDAESEKVERVHEEMSLDKLAAILSLTIKFDHINKIIVFLAMLSAYTDSSQINVSLNAPSSTGKSFLAIEIAKLFPNEDKIERSGSSPTAFFYEAGVPIMKKVKGAKEKQQIGRLVSLERKILLFYEQPNPELQAKLRALLSHDARELKYSFTNRKGGKNQADHVILRGFASSVFCSAGMILDEQEATRAILLSPEATDEKILASLESQVVRSANADEYNAWLNSEPSRNELIKRIVAIRDERIEDIIVPDPLHIKDQFRKMFPIAKARHMRDIKHLMQLIKAIALLNVWHRRAEDGKIYANENDVRAAFVLWEALSESQEYNLPPAVMRFYRNIIIPAYLDKYTNGNNEIKSDMRGDKIGLTPQELNNFHIKVTEKTINGDQVRKQILPQLENSGLVVMEKPTKDFADKRTRHLFPKWFPEGDDPKNIGLGGDESDILDDLDKETYEMFFGTGDGRL
ncbi:hypothetical protein EON76_00295 [bacterium]|nr:MAG: hypothetical protein EON76_00295 [bacterium]